MDKSASHEDAQYVAWITETVDWWAMRVWEYVNQRGVNAFGGPLAHVTLCFHYEEGDIWKLHIGADEDGDIVWNVGDESPDEVHVAVHADGRLARLD
jgi:hypothetical protein